jgi:hypothetical protein
MTKETRNRLKRIFFGAIGILSLVTGYAIVGGRNYFSSDKQPPPDPLPAVD